MIKKAFSGLIGFAYGMLYRSTLLYRLISTLFFLGQWAKWGRTVIPYLQGRRVLDIGHGPGDLLVAMNRVGYSCFGAELSPAMLDGAAANFRKARLPHQLCRASVLALPYQTGTFDNVTSTFPTEYIFQSATLAEIYRVLRPGGRLLLIPTALLLPAILQPYFVPRIWAGLVGPQGVSQRVPLSQAGFTVESQLVSRRASVVFLVVATKPL